MKRCKIAYDPVTDLLTIRFLDDSESWVEEIDSIPILLHWSTNQRMVNRSVRIARMVPESFWRAWRKDVLDLVVDGGVLI